MSFDKIITSILVENIVFEFFAGKTKSMHKLFKNQNLENLFKNLYYKL